MKGKRLAIITTTAAMSIAAAMSVSITASAAPAIEEFFSTTFNFLNDNADKTVTGSVFSNMSGWSLENSTATATLSCVNIGTEESPNYALQYENSASSAMLKYTWGYWATKNKSINFDIKILSGAVKIAFRDNANAWRTARDVLDFSTTGDITFYGSQSQAYRATWTTGNWYNVNIIIDNSNTSGVAPALIEVRANNKNGTLIRRQVVQVPAPNTASAGAALLELVTRSANTSYIIDNASFGRVYDRALAEADQGKCAYPAADFAFVANRSKHPLMSNMKGRTAYAEFSVKDFEGSPTEPVVIIASYDGDGRLLGCNTQDADLTSGAFSSVSLEIPADAASVRAFVWDKDNAQPISASISAE